MTDFNNFPTYAWAAVIIGGPLLLAIAVLIAKFKNGAKHEGLDVKDGSLKAAPPTDQPTRHR
ncbi:hypothetical protein [Sphingomonas sp. 3P27F8]|uniref:hypothetical protein n=1 Tax=Sphingomonas sp. 3P27F8 TaxID=2502213 RepID=UPI0010F4B489|nr:hypothetical protein [Sphingomonas sp. 3P27F8]